MNSQELKKEYENRLRILEQYKFINLIKIMDQQSIFEYLDTLQLQITDPIQKQLEYYHDKKNMITSQKKIASPQFKSPQINPLQNDYQHIRKTLSQQTITLPVLEQGLNMNSHKKSLFEKRITFQ